MSDPSESIQLLCLDVDGVLTDGCIDINDHGEEAKRFHVRDGTGIKIWMRLGYEVAIITGRKGMVVRHRCNELGIKFLFQGSADKLRDFNNLIGTLNLEPQQVAMIGDDLPDMPIMQRVGYPIAVADAVAEVREAARHVTVRPGGHAAVREAVEHLLKGKDRWNDALALFEEPSA